MAIDREVFFGNQAEQDWARRQQYLYDGPLGSWALEKSEEIYGIVEAQWILPKTKDGSPHDIYYLRRLGRDPDNNQQYCIRHVACSCITSSESGQDEDLESMFSCSTLIDGVMTRAQEVRVELGLSELWKQHTDVEDSILGLSTDPVDVAILDILNRERKQPDHWLSNRVGGSHELPLLSIILGKQAAELAEHVAELHELGFIEFDGEQTLKLAA